MKRIDGQFVRFVIVGILNTLIGTTTMFFCYDFLRLGYWISTIMNYVVGSIFSYFANKYFTFKRKKKDLDEIVRFVINICTCYFLAYSLAKPIIEILIKSVMGQGGLEITVLEKCSMILGMGIFVILNYLGQKTFVFCKKNEENNDCEKKA